MSRKTLKFKLIAISIIMVCLLIFGKQILLTKTNYQKETERLQQKLVEILGKPEPDKQKKREALKDLAMEVGAGTEHTVYGTPFRLDPQTIERPHTVITETQLVLNINDALRTRSSISAVDEATKSNWIAFGALVISFISLAVAYSAYYKSSQIESKKLFVERKREQDRQLAKR